MTTAIIGVGNIGSRAARLLVNGGEPVILAGKDQSSADSLAGQLGGLASSATVDAAVSQADAVLLAVWLDAESDVISHLSNTLDGKVVMDPSNPVTLDSSGGYARTLPQGQSAGSVVASMLPAGAHYVKGFGSIGATELEAAANRKPKPAVMFYATDDATAATTAERLIRYAGFEPLKVGGVEAAGRIEMGGGDLHQYGGLNGRLLDIDEARAMI
jgi:predicted dinucleotide-binding enzyme